jgi:hypothetical protein
MRESFFMDDFCVAEGKKPFPHDLCVFSDWVGAREDERGERAVMGRRRNGG